jgi:hypothetical protein
MVDKSLDQELMEWVLSFAAAYLLVHNFGTIITTAAKILDQALGIFGPAIALGLL